MFLKNKYKPPCPETMKTEPLYYDDQSHAHSNAMLCTMIEITCT